jgi:Helix-turn-helix domain
MEETMIQKQAPSSPVHDLLTRKEAAYLLRLRPNTLAVWAVKKRFENELPVIRLGRNLIRYRRADIERFVTTSSPNGCSNAP